MTASEQLRNEMAKDCPFTKQEFIGAVTNGIRKDGYYSFCINARTERGYSLSSGATIPSKWLEIARKWATEEGFFVKRIFTAYGVPVYEVTL